MTGYEIKFHSERCVGCQACVAACMEEKDTSPEAGEQPLCRILEQENENGQHLLSWRRESCRHCSNPACVKICPAGGFQKEEETGFVLYDKTSCIACGQCMEVCEEHAISFDREQVIQKCDGCREQVLAGRVPACVSVCPWGALEFIRN